MRCNNPACNNRVTYDSWKDAKRALGNMVKGLNKRSDPKWIKSEIYPCPRHAGKYHIRKYIKEAVFGKQRKGRNRVEVTEQFQV